MQPLMLWNEPDDASELKRKRFKTEPDNASEPGRKRRRRQCRRDVTQLRREESMGQSRTTRPSSRRGCSGTSLTRIEPKPIAEWPWAQESYCRRGRSSCGGRKEWRWGVLVLEERS